MTVFRSDRSLLERLGNFVQRQDSMPASIFSQDLVQRLAIAIHNPDAGRIELVGQRNWRRQITEQ